jgi:hypothetical protein
LDVFGDRWAWWIESAAQASSAPVDFIVGPLLSTASSLIGNARWAQGPGVSSAWKEPPVLWVASVGDSGDGKTPAANMIMRDVATEIDRRIHADYQRRHRDWKAANDLAKQKEDQWKNDCKVAQAAGIPEPLRPLDSYSLPEPARASWIQNDITVERVALSFAGAPKGLLLYRDEIAGFLESMTLYNEGGRAFFLECFNGGRYIVARKYDEPIIIEHLTAALCGGIQPERLARWLGGNPDDGFASRIGWFWPEPLEYDLPKTICDTSFALDAFDRLRELELIQFAGEETPAFVPLVPSAAPMLRAFGRRMQAEQRETAGLLRSAYGKARGWALRLALVLEYLWWAAGDSQSLVAGTPSVISERVFAAACEFTSDYVLPMAARAYGDAALPRSERSATTLARWIAKTRPPEVHVRSLYRTVRLPGLTTVDAVHAACQELIAASWLLEGTRGGGKNHQRTAYPINPKLWGALDEAGL